MTALKLDLLAPAKINLSLRIGTKRPDGYHQLHSLFQLLDLHDRITLTYRADGALKLHTQGAFQTPNDERNLALQAAQLLQPLCSQKPPGADITLDKCIPTAAGLGGGSSDAACILHGLNRLWALDLPTGKLAQLGLSLGADIPFFVAGNNALATGKGEQLQPVCLPDSYYLIALPQIELATAEMYRLLSEHTRRQPLPELAHADYFDLIQNGQNDFLDIALQFPEVNGLYEKMQPLGPVQLSGTGSALFVRFDSQQQAQVAQRQLKAQGLPNWMQQTNGVASHRALFTIQQQL